MNRFSVDYETVLNAIDKKSYKLKDVHHRLEKVAFDVVRFKDGDPEQLWQIQSAEDGEYIVTLYDEEQKKTASANVPWKVLLNKSGTDLYIFYKDTRVTKLASSTLGLPESELPVVQSYLPNRLAKNPELVAALLNGLDAVTKAEIIQKHPELGNGLA